MELALFIIFGLLAMVGAFGVLFSKKPVHSALFLLLNFVMLGFLYLVLGAQFLAASQLIVYAGAIMVLFLFVIMLIGSETVGDFVAKGRTLSRYLGIVLGVLFLAGVGYAVGARAFPPAAGAPDYGATETVGKVLFTQFLVPFELVSVLLLVAMVGAILLARGVWPAPSRRPRE